MSPYSKYSLLICFLIIIAVLSCKPKWTQKQAHATISFDVSGYYIYLPAIFIYKDLKKVSFKEEIHQKYQNSSHTYQTSTFPNGNEIAKYPFGQALQYLPFFLVADMLAEPLGYERDGYTRPYQAGIHWGSVLIAFLGLFYLRKNLLEYFSDKVAALTLFFIVIGTNYLNYASVDAAMTHNYLFTLFSLIIWNTIQWYKKPTYARAAGLGFLLGLAALTRPTEIMMAMIPIFWGVDFISKGTRKTNLLERFSFLKKHYPKLLLSAIVCTMLGSIQLVYWKYVGDTWIINSYGDDAGFDWLKPHIKDGLISFRKGWLIYTPIMIFALLGIGLMLKKKHDLGSLIFIYTFLFIYITFSWSIWWYSGSLGQRPMVQAYALLTFPFAYTIQWMLENKKRFIPFLAVSLFCCYFNIWLHYQAHIGGQFEASEATQTYFLATFLKWKKNPDDFKYLDTNERFLGKRKNIKRIYFNDFEQDSILGNCQLNPIHGNKSYCIIPKTDLNNVFNVPLDNKQGTWIRGGGIFMQQFKEWNMWLMPQFIIQFKHKNNIVKQKLIRIPRVMDYNETREIFFDTKIPKENIDEVELLFFSKTSEFPIIVDDLYIEVFK